MTGTLLSAGDEIRVTAQLTDAASGTLLCSHSTQTSTGNVFRLQDELTECMVSALALRLTAREQQILRQDVPSDPKAYEYYLARQSVQPRLETMERGARPVSALRGSRSVLCARVGAPRANPPRDGEVSHHRSRGRGCSEPKRPSGKPST